MHHATPLITTIVGGLVLAFILGMIANKLRISPLVGYLLAGVLAGPFTPGFVADTKLAPELAELGVILLMFGVGLHFSLKDLMAVKSIAIPGAIAQIAVATLLGMALSAALGWSLMTGIVFGLCLSTASTVVLLRALEERQLIDSQRGQIAIGWLIVEDPVMVLTLVLLPAIAGMAEKGNVGFASPALDLGITIGKVVAFIAIMMLVGRRLVPWIMSRSAATGSRELFTLSVLAPALGIAFGAVELFDVSLPSAPSLPAWCLTNPSSATAPPMTPCRCATPSRCCSSSPSACCLTRWCWSNSRWRCWRRWRLLSLVNPQPPFSLCGCLVTRRAPR